jgi:imidazolonepropionase-like amidohydrolase
MKTALTGGRIVDGSGDPAIQNGAVYFNDDRIIYVGPVNESPIEADVTIDISGKTVLPGLFNCHAHLAWDGVEDIHIQSVEDSASIAAFKMAANMKRSLRAGVTTVRDLGVHRWNLAAKEAVQRHIVSGPRVIASGAAISMTGGHTWWCCREADGIADVRKAVREQLKDGADVIKVMASSATESEFTVEELEAMAEEAHRAKVPITAHAFAGPAIRRVVEAGFDSVEHGGPMDEETIKLMKQKGTYLIPTFSPVTLQALHGLEHGMSRAHVERRNREMRDERRYASIARAAKEGVRICMGTDAGSPLVRHDEIVTELKMLIEYGVCDTPMETLVCSTKHAAEVCKVDDRLGTLAVGKQADLVIVEGNPLENLDALRKVERVYIDGIEQDL